MLPVHKEIVHGFLRRVLLVTPVLAVAIAGIVIADGNQQLSTVHGGPAQLVRALLAADVSAATSTYTLTASPNPCTIQSGSSTCATTISWTIPAGATTQLWVSLAGGSPAQVACKGGPQTVTQSIPWITATNYTFNLYEIAGGGCTTNPTSLPADATIGVSGVPRTYQNGNVLYLDTGTARIGVNLSWGGSITHLEKGSASYVNRHDTGREVQLALWDGNLTYDSCGGCTGNFGWNPTQAGDTYNHTGSVLQASLENNTIYTKTEPLEWYPDNKGGGSGTPVPNTDVRMEQWITAVPGIPQAFKVHYKSTYTGTTIRGSACQEFPAVYVNGAYNKLVYYGGTSPWTGGALSNTTTLPSPEQGGFTKYASERWAALVDASGDGLSVYVPDSLPYISGFGHQASGTGPTDDQTYYFRFCTSHIHTPNTTHEGDAYLIVGNTTTARNIISQLRTSYPTVFSATGRIESPSGSQVSGTISITGWAIGSSAISTIKVFIDGVNVLSFPAGTVATPEVQSAWPNAPLNSGFQGSLNTTTLTSGTHTMILQAVDAQGHSYPIGAKQINVSN